MEAHRGPCGGRPAVVMHGVEDFEDFGRMHPAVRPVEPCVVDDEIGQQADGEVPQRHGVDISVNLRPAMMLPAPCDDACGRSIDERAGEAPEDFASDLLGLLRIKAREADAGGEGEAAAGEEIAHRDDHAHADNREKKRVHETAIAPMRRGR